MHRPGNPVRRRGRRGKSDALLAAGVLTCLVIPGCKVILFRRTFKMLEQEILPRLLQRLPDSIAHYTAGEHLFTFRHNGSTLRLGYLDKPRDLENYTGPEYVLVLWDELTQFTRKQYTFMRSRLRMAGKVKTAMQARGWIPSMIATTNPGGVGHSWVKRMFVDPAIGRHDQIFEGGIEPGEDPRGLRTMAYIPAKATDNPFLDLRAYRQNLAGLDTVLRRALEQGDWDILEGVRFSQFRRAAHVIRPEQMPVPMLGYPRGVGIDWGISAPFVAVWGALLPDDLIVVYREVDSPNLTAEQQARLVLESEEPGERAPHRPLPSALDPSCWIRGAMGAFKPVDPSQPAPGSIAWWYRKAGLPVIKANNDRIGGWHQLDHHLRVREDGLPRLLIYDNCVNLIRTLPELMRSNTNPEDVSTSPKQEDHWADALRYLVMLLVGGGVRRVTPDAPAYDEERVSQEQLDQRYDTLMASARYGRNGHAVVPGNPWASRRGETDS